MGNVHGLGHFTVAFKEYADGFVIIGGTAASEFMRDSSLEFRATKDIDLVILATSARRLANLIVEYVKEGGYEVREATEGEPRYYRFTKPKQPEFPAQIEIFSRNSESITLEGDQKIIPLPTDAGEGLSAILLDDDYFEIIKANVVVSEAGHRIVNNLGNICLKARAFVDLRDNKRKTGTGDSKHFEKHRNDVLKLALPLTGGESYPLKGRPAQDLIEVLAAWEALSPEQGKGILKGYGLSEPTAVLSRIRAVFGLKK